MPPRTRRLAAAVCLIALALTPPVSAQTPVTDAAHIAVNLYYHILHYVQFATQIYQHYTQIANQIRQIEYQLQALKKLEHPNWREVADLIAYLDLLMKQGEALAYSLGDINQRFLDTFPGWQEWQSWPLQYRNQTVRALETMRTGLNTVAEQAHHDIADQIFLSRIQSQMDSIHGTQEALELNATLQAFTAQELSVIKQSLATGNNMASVYYAEQLNRDAQANASLAAALDRTLSDPVPAAPGYSFVPTWWPY
jgi:P-type conjugative transfer protein TrbJ